VCWLPRRDNVLSFTCGEERPEELGRGGKGSGERGEDGVTGGEEGWGGLMAAEFSGWGGAGGGVEEGRATGVRARVTKEARRLCASVRGLTWADNPHAKPILALSAQV